MITICVNKEKLINIIRKVDQIKQQRNESSTTIMRKKARTKGAVKNFKMTE